LVQAFKQVEEGDFKTAININQSDEFDYLYARFDQMLDNLNSMVEQAYTHKIMMQRAQLKHLQSQINPHFLYNSFFLLYNIAQAEGSESVVELSERLGKYFKYITRDASDVVPLKEEADTSMF
jgi:two-component system sensor histidine kinase YesM